MSGADETCRGENVSEKVQICARRVYVPGGCCVCVDGFVDVLGEVLRHESADGQTNESARVRRNRKGHDQGSGGQQGVFISPASDVDS